MMPVKERVRWGLLGTGNINVKLLAGARLSDHVEVVAVGSRTPERGKAFAAEHDIPRVHGSYEALLADPEVDALYINLPNGMHHEWTMRSIAAGKHILCEKPYSRHPAEVSEAFDAAATAGVVLQEAFMWRHSPQTLRLLELLPEIGQLVNIRATFSFAIANQSDIRLSKELKGGSLMDVGCYCVSGSRLLAGAEPDRVYAEQVLGPSGVDIGFSGLLHFPGGVTSEIVSGFRMEHQGLEAIGTLGSIQVPDSVALARRDHHPQRRGDPPRRRQPLSRGAGQHVRRYPRHGRAAAGSPGCAGPVAHHRGAVPLSRHGAASHPRRLTLRCAPCIAVQR